MTYDIEADLGGHCKCSVEASHEDGEVIIHSITPHNFQLTFTEAHGRFFNALESLIDKKHIEDIILDRLDHF